MDFCIEDSTFLTWYRLTLNATHVVSNNLSAMIEAVWDFWKLLIGFLMLKLVSIFFLPHQRSAMIACLVWYWIISGTSVGEESLIIFDQCSYTVASFHRYWITICTLWPF